MNLSDAHGVFIRCIYHVFIIKHNIAVLTKRRSVCCKQVLYFEALRKYIEQEKEAVAGGSAAKRKRVHKRLDAFNELLDRKMENPSCTFDGDDKRHWTYLTLEYNHSEQHK
jgi:hypothetical protein